jgi:hypothetical protein
MSIREVALFRSFPRGIFRSLRDLEWGQIKAILQGPDATLWALGQGHPDQGVVRHVERDLGAHCLVDTDFPIQAWLWNHEVAQLAVAEDVHQLELALIKMGVQGAS